MEYLTDTLQWLVADTRGVEQDDFLKNLFNSLDEAGLKRCLSLISKTRKRRKELQALQLNSETLPREKKIRLHYLLHSEGGKQSFTTSRENTSQRLDAKDSASQGLVPTGSVPAGSVPTGSLPEYAVSSLPTSQHPTVTNQAHPKKLAATGWLSNWTVDDVVSLDVEKVQIPRNSSSAKPKYTMKAAIVSIVDSKGKCILQKRIRREYGTYKVNVHTIKINGITETSLQQPDCEDEKVVMEAIDNCIRDKLVVGVDICNDFSSMVDLPMGHYKVFDLQNHYFTTYENQYNQLVRNKVGLKKLVKHYFNEEIQTGIHDATLDAKWTMRFFLEVYCKMNPPPANPFNDDIMGVQFLS